MRNAKSSTTVAMCGSTSLTQRPHSPCRRNANGLFSTLNPGELVTDSTRRPSPGSNFCPSKAASSGLWSKVSIWLTPPFMNN